MKKYLLLLSFLLVSLSAIHAAEGQLNAYAYGATMTYLPQSQQLVVSWSLQADASSVVVVAKDKNENKFVLRDFGSCTRGAYQNQYMDLKPLIEAGLPMYEDLKVIIEVKTADRAEHEPLGLKTTAGNNNEIHSPFSIDIDDNPESHFYGLMYVTQMRDGAQRGIYVYDQWMTLVNKQIDSDIKSTSDWYYSTRGVPHMVRAFPDGSGKLLVSSSDRDQSTHIWLVDTKEAVNAIPVLTDWKPLITSAQLAEWTGEPSSTIFANASVDIRSNGKNWDILIYAATVEPSSASNPTGGHEAGRVYTGVYSVPKTNAGLLGGTYTSLTAYDNSTSTSHEYVSNAYTSSMLSATANFDKFGGVLYNASTEDVDNNPEGSGLIHKTLAGQFSAEYVDGSYLMRKSIRTKGARFNQDFSKLAIAQGSLDNELRIYNVSQIDGNSHLELSEGVSVDLVPGHSAELYIHDIAWDLAQNIFVSVRNSSSHYGIYAIATDLDDTPVCTPIRGTLKLGEPHNVEWYNLFQEGKDITTLGVDANDNNVNNRLWYLFLARLKETGATITDYGTIDQTDTDKKRAFWVVKTLTNVNKTDLNDFLTNQNSSFYWLGKYILDETNEDIQLDSYSYEWKYLLHLFFNRTKWCYNSNGGSNVNSIIAYQFNNSTIPDFSEKGHPDYWRPYWTRYACNLPMMMTKNEPMPIEWNRISAPTKYVTYEPTWYKWNTADAPQNGGNEFTHILAWRKGSATGEIKTCVDEDNLQLFATYVRKNIHENDPAEDLSQDPCDATNSDIFKLLYNKTWDAPWHKISITRKLQGGMFNTICLPFHVDLAKDLPSNSPLLRENAEFWEYTGATSSFNQTGEDVTILNFTQISSTGALKAGVPYLVTVDNDITDEYLYFGGELSNDSKTVLMDTVPKVVEPVGSAVPISFVGVINPEKNLPAQSLILVADSRLASTTEPGRMEGLRGYFRIDPMWAADIAEQAADGRVYLSMKKPVTTSIPIAPEAEQQTKPEVRKVMYDGNIYILRGDEVYTITGNRVK